MLARLLGFPPPCLTISPESPAALGVGVSGGVSLGVTVVISSACLPAVNGGGVLVGVLRVMPKSEDALANDSPASNERLEASAKTLVVPVLAGVEV